MTAAASLTAPTSRVAGSQDPRGGNRRFRDIGGRMLRRGILPLVLTGLLVTALAAPAAHAAAGVSISSTLGGATADADYATTLQLRGSGFQSVQGGFGGIYVLFGWAGPGWRPSEGGVVGADYRYIPDSESVNNQGFQRFVSFPGSETESSAQAVMGADGTWAVDMVVPGAVFTAVDRAGNAVEVDCRTVQCGVITIGAHGVKNANNETFTPVEFVTPSGGATASEAAAGGGSEAPDAVAAPVGELRIGFEEGSAVAGNAFAFTARGFAPGEQVVASLDRGAVAVGPLTAGTAGEVAAVLPLPTDLAAGTHLLTVTGAASGSVAEAEIVVAASGVATVAADAAPAVPPWVYTAMLAAIGLAAVLLVTNVLVRIVRGVRRRRAREEVRS